LSDAARTVDADGLVFQVVGARGDLTYGPAAVHHAVVSRDVVADERQDLHYRVLRDADGV